MKDWSRDPRLAAAQRRREAGPRIQAHADRDGLGELEARLLQPPKEAAYIVRFTDADGKRGQTPPISFEEARAVKAALRSDREPLVAADLHTEETWRRLEARRPSE